jgi:hypothetical protein
LLSVLLSFALVAPISAEQSPTQATVPRDTQAVAILQQAVAAMGGAPSDSTFNGTVTATIGSQSQTGTIQVFTLGTNQSQEVIALPDFSQTTTYSGWMASQANGSATTQVSSQLAATSQTALFPSPLLVGALNSPDYALQYVGIENVGGAPANHIRVWNTFASSLTYFQPVSSFTTRDIWLDQTSSLPVKITFTQQAASGASFKTLVELDFSNYQQSGGFTYPSLIQKSVNGTPWLTISIQTLAFNTGLQSSQFQVNCSNS